MATASMACTFSIHMKIVENSINNLINKKYKVQIWINTKRNSFHQFWALDNDLKAHELLVKA